MTIEEPKVNTTVETILEIFKMQNEIIQVLATEKVFISKEREDSKNWMFLKEPDVLK